MKTHNLVKTNYLLIIWRCIIASMEILLTAFTFAEGEYLLSTIFLLFAIMYVYMIVIDVILDMLIDCYKYELKILREL